MTHFNSPSHMVTSTFLVPEEVMAIEIPKNEEMFGGRKNGGVGLKEVGSAFRGRRANGGT